MRLLVPLIALLLTASSGAEESRFRTQWSESCKFGSTSFQLTFKSKSGDPTEDDMVVGITWASSKQISLRLKPALFVQTKYVSDADNACKAVGAFKLPSGRVLLLLGKDGRPVSDSLHALVLNPQTGALVQDAGELGSFDSHAMLLKTKRGFRVLLQRSGYLNLGGGGGEFSAPDWMLIQESQGVITSRWETFRQ